VIRQPRPIVEKTGKPVKETYGMPSSHSCSIAFFGVYIALASTFCSLHPRIMRLFPINLTTDVYNLVTRTSREAEQVGQLLEIPIRTLFGVGAIVGSGSVCWSRIYLGHHNTPQVIAGAALGSTVAIVWFLLWTGTKSAGLDLPLPESVAEGLAVRTQVLERALEDSIYRILEVWGKGDYMDLGSLLGDVVNVTRSVLEF
jgi:dolichyldiphosphatase